MVHFVSFLSSRATVQENFGCNEIFFKKKVANKLVLMRLFSSLGSLL